MLKQFIAGVVVALTLTSMAVAGEFEEGAQAYYSSDYATALRLWQPLAEQGDAMAQHALALMYTNGEGVPQDFREAVRWYRLAAEQGYSSAQYILGRMYDHGEGVPQDHAEAAKWYRLAAEQGELLSQTGLGVLYANGRGVPQDYVLAHMWFNLAAAHGSESGRTYRDNVAKLMTPDQIAEAQRLAREAVRGGAGGNAAWWGKPKPAH
jgi:TPR repeat protein